MSKLAVANIIFESTEANRIEYTGNNVIRVRANGGFQLPYGTTAQRASPETGLIRYNTDTGLVESYGTGGWMAFPDGNYVNAISDKATAGLVVANAAFASANNVAPQVTPSYNTANAAYNYANNLGLLTASAFNTANAAYGAANNVGPQIAPAFNTANAAFAAANNITPQIAPSYNTANSAYNTANSAYNAANNVNLSAPYNTANAAYNTANAAYTAANNASVGPAYNTANAAFAKANNALANTDGTVFNGNLRVSSTISVPLWYENDSNISTNATLTMGRNAMMAGPVTLNAGYTITIPANSTLAVV